jgi:hypothetical protein
MKNKVLFIIFIFVLFTSPFIYSKKIVKKSKNILISNNKPNLDKCLVHKKNGFNKSSKHYIPKYKKVSKLVHNSVDDL